MKISVNKDFKAPLYWQIADQIKDMIFSGALVKGSYLPSERTLAKMTGVHRNTVIKAYDMLKDYEYIDSEHGVGYIVTYGEQEQVNASGHKSHNKKVNWSNAINDIYQDMEKTFDKIFARFAEGKNISFSSGMPPATYSNEQLSRDLAAVVNEEEHKPFYLSPYQGDKMLIQRSIEYLRTKGIKAGKSQIQVLSETNQALDFISTALLNSGDYVVIEEPVSPDVYRIIELAGCKAVTIPVDEKGMQCDMLETVIERYKPKFIYVNSSYHDPTGNILSLDRRKKLLELSGDYRIPIIEDDSASEISFSEHRLPALKALDENENVIYIYSFALTFVPGMSMALVVASSKMIKILSRLVSVRIMSLDWITQKLLAKYISDGRYFQRVDEIRELSRRKRDIMCSYLEELKIYGVDFRIPEGGVYIWCKLPANVSCKEVTAAALKRGLTIIPGEVFYLGRHGGKNHIRLNYSYESEERIREGMNILTDVIKVLVLKK